MKCNQCGTTIPEGSKICNGCGKKVTIFSNVTNSPQVNNNYKIIDNYNNLNQSQEIETEIFEETEITEEIEIENEIKTIKDKNAIDSYAYSLVGFFFPIIGFIFIILAINKASAIKDPEEKKKAKTLVKIAFVANIITTIASL